MAKKPEPTGWAAKWHRWKFHLSALLLIVPVAYLQTYFTEVEMNRGQKGLGEREIGEKQVGPWTVKLAEDRLWEPLGNKEFGYTQGFNLSLCEACIPEIRAAYIRVGKPRSLRTAGAVFFGSPYRMSAGMVIPERTRHDDDLWLTVEGWDGSVHHASWTLAEASPITVAWLKKQGR
jgi:hypothetical protein